MTNDEHHAILIEAAGEQGIASARQYIKEVLGLTIAANPDITLYEVEQYTVKDARALKGRAAQAPLGSRQAFVLVFERITHAAQNALLKLLEEPCPQTYFVLVVPSAHVLLPTVRSRVSVHTAQVDHAPSEQGQTFLSASPKERLAQIARLVKDADRPGARILCDGLEAALYAAHGGERHRMLREVAFVRTHLARPGSSLKMLLEHLAVTL